MTVDQLLDEVDALEPLQREKLLLLATGAILEYDHLFGTEVLSIMLKTAKDEISLDEAQWESEVKNGRTE